MQLWITGLASVYDVEHVARLFYPGARLCTSRPGWKQDTLHAHAGRRHLWVALRLGGHSVVRRLPLAENEKPGFVLSGMVYDLLREQTGIRPPWGKMTGVRPVRLIHDARRRGKSEQEIKELFCGRYDCTKEKFHLARQIADLQRPWVEHPRDRDCSLYIGIPFCPSRCSYCSFVSRTTGQDGKLMQPYVDALCMELEAFRQQVDQNRLTVKSMYIGGGTPTSLTAPQLRQLLQKVKQLFPPEQMEEFTVEAGRPDCTDREKLDVLKEYGVTRISINPQTFSDEVLRRIGRRHTAQDILECFSQARAAGHHNINMDLIAGLPGDTVEGFEKSLNTAIGLHPENITVHTLTLKRASNLVIDREEAQEADVAAMLSKCDALARAGYHPYYLYRQKGTLQNLENIGWCLPGTECAYNIYIMEEVHSILSAGAGGSTKLCAAGKMKRVFNYKYPHEYLDGLQEILRRKQEVTHFYEKNENKETSGEG